MEGSGTPTRYTEGRTVVIHLPDPRLLLLIARVVIVATLMIFVPCLRRVPPRGALVQSSHCSDDPFSLPVLIRDLEREGLFWSNRQKAIFLGNAGCMLQFLKNNGINHVPSNQESNVREQSVDFALASEGFEDASVRLVDRVLKIGGVVVTQLSSEGSSPFHVPGNYRLVYVRRFGSTIVALRKIAQANYENGITGIECGIRILNRKLLAMPSDKKDVLEQIEDVLLEPPTKITETRRIKFLPEIIGYPLTKYPRRVFIDAGLHSRANFDKWFEESYPKKGSTFEMFKLNSVGNRKTGHYQVSDWLERNVKEEEFVVMKAEAGIVEEMVKGKEKAIRLVDELFLKCDLRRPYWECLTLYGKVKDKGVVVHQWWEWD